MPELISGYPVLASFTVPRHCVAAGPDGLSRLQQAILTNPAPVRVFSAPTGAGKSYALIKAVTQGTRCLFVVPTRRLAQNLATAAVADIASMNPQLTPEAASQLVAVWSSDATAEARKADPTLRIGLYRVRQVRMIGPEVRFVVTTPESVAALLLNHAGRGYGTTGLGIADYGFFDHIVFDEFHAIDARGFGLAAVAAAVAAQTPGLTKVTFLSATPVNLMKVLVETGTPREAISIDAEHVVTTTARITDAGEPLRALHGDVAFTFVDCEEMADLLAFYRDEVRRCLDRGRQLVIIYDSIEALMIDKARLAAVLDDISVTKAERLAINSVDDSRSMQSLGDLFVVDRAEDPLRFKVLVATSSVEMGVTFKAGLILMDAGFSPMSFVQRAGRVARGDEPGTVIVRITRSAASVKPWLRVALQGWTGQVASSGTIIIEDFINIVRSSVPDRLADSSELSSDEPPATFRTMAGYAQWCAALFLYVMGKDAKRGENQSVWAYTTKKTGIVARKLKEVAKPVIPGGSDSQGARWVEAFLKEVATLREFQPSATLIEPDGRRQTVPMRMIESRPALAAAPMAWPSGGGPVEVRVDRPLEAILSTTDKAYVEERRRVFMPVGQPIQVRARSAVEETIQEFNRLIRAERNLFLRTRLETAKSLVSMSRLLPRDPDTLLQAGR